MTPEVRGLFQELLEREVHRAYGDPIGYFHLAFNNSADSIFEWQKLMQESCKEVGMDFADTKLGLRDVEVERFGRYLAEERSFMTYEKWVKILNVDPEIMGGTPCFHGTRVSVGRIGELSLRGESLISIQIDYPWVTERDVEFAKRFREGQLEDLFAGDKE